MASQKQHVQNSSCFPRLPILVNSNLSTQLFQFNPEDCPGIFLYLTPTFIQIITNFYCFILWITSRVGITVSSLDDCNSPPVVSQFLLLLPLWTILLGTEWPLQISKIFDIEKQDVWGGGLPIDMSISKYVATSSNRRSQLFWTMPNVESFCRQLGYI